MELEQEAIEYAFKQYGNSCGAREERVISKEDFIAGANSNYVQIEKLKFAIEQIKSLSTMKDSSYFYSTKEGSAVEKLEQQLKELKK